METPKTVRWGIMATGFIAQTFAKDILIDPNTRKVTDVKHVVSAVASSSSKSAAEAFIGKHVAPNQFETQCTPYGSYEELVKDPNVAIIYMAFPDVGFSRGDLSLYLKLQYHAHTCGIFWLALYKAVITTDQSPELVSGAEKCVRSYCSFVDAAADFFTKPVLLPHIAMTLTSIFTVSLSMTFVKNAQVPFGLEQLDN